MQISTMRIDELDKLHIKKIGEKKLPEFSPGDTLKVNVRIIEGKRQRGEIPTGEIILNPHWEYNYKNLLDEFLKNN